MERPIKNRSRNKILLILDGSMLLAFMAASAPQLGGLELHEWIGVACGVMVMAHLLLNWDWIVATTRRLRRTRQTQTRLGYLLNWALFLDVAAILVTGLAISRTVFPWMPDLLPRLDPAYRGRLWVPLHDLATQVFLALVGLHLALHWDWLVTTVKRMAGGRREGRVTAQPGGEAAR